MEQGSASFIWEGKPELSYVSGSRPITGEGKITLPWLTRAIVIHLWGYKLGSEPTFPEIKESSSVMREEREGGKMVVGKAETVSALTTKLADAWNPKISSLVL